MKRFALAIPTVIGTTLGNLLYYGLKPEPDWNNCFHVSVMMALAAFLTAWSVGSYYDKFERNNERACT